MCMLPMLIVLASMSVLPTIQSNQNPLIIVSLDGVSWQYKKQSNAQTPDGLDFIERTGVKAQYMRNVFPTSTWPMHQTLLTGLFAESHGIVSNVFWVPKYKRWFHYDIDCTNFDPKYWAKAEPIWLTNQKNGGRSGMYFWPGFSSYEIKPTFYEKEICFVNCSTVVKGFDETKKKQCEVNYKIPYTERVDTIMTWLKSEKPPNFVALYIDHPDAEGHWAGVTSQKYKKNLEFVDKNSVAYLIKKLKEEKMLETTNIIVLSDHGFPTKNPQETIFTEDFVDFKDLERRMINQYWPKEGKTEKVYKQLSKGEHISVFRKDDIPESLHWKNSDRIPPIVVTSDEGYKVFTKRKFEKIYPPNIHDFIYPTLPDTPLYPIFYARGPAFRLGYASPPIDATDVYPLMCKLLGLSPLPNNGSLENVKNLLKPSWRTKFT